MNTLVIYNKETGEVIMTRSGDSITSVGAVTADVPNGKLVESVNLETGEVILVDAPKSEEQARIEALEKQMAALLGEE